MCAKILVKNIIKNLSSKYSPKRPDNAKQFATNAFKTSSKRVIEITVEANGDLIGNKIANEITRVSKSPQNNSVTNEEIPREKYISSKLKQKNLMIQH